MSHKSYVPTHSYAKTMQLYVATDGGRVCTVEEVPSKTFATLMAVAATSADDPIEVNKQLAGLDFAHMADRWWCCEFLAEHGARLPLFSTSIEARQSQVTPIAK